MAGSQDETERVYVLGHSEWEIDRLNRQAGLVDGITGKLFADAGLTAGMSVLDLGSGSGSVSLIAAQIVGPRGRVTGFDLSPTAVSTATARARAIGHENVSFRLGNPADSLGSETFDAVIGRYVLMFLPDPAEMLRRLSRHLAPGGIVAFHEPAWEHGTWSQKVPSYEACARWCALALAKQGADIGMGLKLHDCFTAAGLPAPTLSLSAGIGAAAQGLAWADLVLDLLQTLRPDAIRLGIASEEALDIEDLRDRIEGELTQPGALILGRYEVGAWSRR